MHMWSFKVILFKGGKKMYSILLVEDEIIELETLSGCHDHGF